MTLWIAAGQTASTGTVTVTGVDNDVHTADKTVKVKGAAGNTVGASGPADVTLTLEDDDTRGVTVSKSDLDIDEGDDGAYTVVLASQPTGQVTVTPSRSSGDADVTVSGALTFTPANWDTAQTVTVSSAQDPDAIDDTAVIGHTVSGGDYGSVVAASVAVTVDDDETASSGVTLTVSPDSVSEGASATTVTVTASLNGGTRGDATPVSVTVGSGTATSGTDFAAVTGFSISIPANTQSHTGAFTLTPTQDTVDEPSESVTVSGTTTVTGFTVRGATVGIADDDASPTVTLALSDTSIAEDGGVATVTASLSHPSSVATRVTVDLWPISPANLSANMTLWIAAGRTASTGAVTVTGVDNDVDAANKTVAVQGSTSNTVGVFPPASVSLTLEDDDTRGVTVSKTDLDIDEGDDGAYTVVLDSEPTASVTVRPSRSSGDADVTVSGALTFRPANWDTAQTVTVSAAQDLDAIDDTAVIGHAVSGGDYGSVPAGSVAVTVDDDEMASTGVTLTVSPESVSEGASATTVTVTASLNGGTRGDATPVAVTVGSGTAASGTDFGAVAGFQISIAANTLSNTGTFSLSPTQDTSDEPDETVTVGGTTTVSGFAVTGATVEITDDDASPTVTLSLSDTSIAEDGGATTVTASLSHASSVATTVTVSVSPDSPAVAGDYGISANQALTIAAGQTASTGAVTVTGVNNDVDAADKTVKVQGTAGNTVGITGPADVTLTLEDDDTRGVTVSKSELDIDEGDDGAYTVVLDSKPTGSVTVTPSRSSGDADVTVSGALTFTTVNWDTAQTVTVSAAQDLDAIDDTAVIGHAVSGGDYGSVVAASVDVTVDDDETASTGVTLTVSPDSVSEGASATTVTVTASLNGGTRGDATPVAVTVGSGTAVSGTDFGAVAGFQISIAANTLSNTGTFSLSPTQDTSDEPDETVTVGGTTTVSGFAVTGTTVEITDDDASPTVTLSLSDTSIAEDGGATTVTASLSHASSVATTVTVSVSPDSPAVAGDYGISANQALTIAAGQTASTGAVTVTGVDNDVDAADKTVKVQGTAGNTVGITGPADVTLTLEDDDTRGVTVSKSELDIDEGDDGAYTVVLASKPTGSVTVTPSRTSGSTDVTVSGALTFTPANWDTAQTVTVSAAQDPDAIDDTAVLGHAVSGGDYGSVVAASVDVTVDDDETASTGVTLTVSPDSVSEGASATTVTVTASLNGGTRGDATPVSVTVGSGTATSGTDFAAVTGFSISIPANTRSHTGAFTLTPTQDKIDDDAETVVVTASNGGDMIGTATVTIDDDDAAPALAVDVSSATIAEAGGASTLTVSTGSGSTFATDQTINLALGGTATAGDDYTIGSSDVFPSGVSISAMTLTLPAGVGTAAAEITIAITALQDIIDEPDETILIDAAIGQTAVGTRQTVTITDDDQAALTIADAAANEGDEITFTVTLDPVSSREVTVDWATSVASGDTAAQADFTAGSGTLTFAAGDSSKTFTVATAEETVSEPDETFTVTLSGASGATLPADATATGTITDDDQAPLSIAHASAHEGDSATFTVTLNPAAADEVTVDYATSVAASDTAAQSDFTAGNGTLTFAAGDTTETFTVATLEDSVDEVDETFTVTLSNASGSTLPTDPTATGTIIDDDQAALTIADAGADEGDDITFTVTLNPVSSREVTVDWATSVASGDTAVQADFTADSGTLTFAAGDSSKTFTVATTEETTLEPDETFTVTLSDASEATLPADPTATGTIGDDDTPRVSIASGGDVAQEGTAATFTLTMSPAAPTGGLTVNVTVAEVERRTLEAGELAYDFVAAASEGMTTVDFAAGDTSATLTVPTVDDDLYEAEFGDDNLLRATLAAGTGYAVATGSGTAELTLRDGADQPLATWKTAKVTVTEGTDANAALVLTLTHALVGEVAFDLIATQVSASLGNDYTFGVEDPVFAPGTTEVTTLVPIVHRPRLEATETFDVSFLKAVASQPGAVPGTFAERTLQVEILDADTMQLDPAAVSARVVEGEAIEITIDTLPSGACPIYFEFFVTVTPSGDTATLADADAVEQRFAACASTQTVSFATREDTAVTANRALSFTLATRAGTDSRITVVTDNVVEVAVIDDDRHATGAPAIAGTAQVGRKLTASPGTIADGDGLTGATYSYTWIRVDGATETAITGTTGNGYTPVAADEGKTLKVRASFTDDEGFDEQRESAETATVAAAPTMPTFGITDASAAEGDDITFTVTLNPAAGAAATVAWATSVASGDTAVQADFTAGSGTLNFGVGDTSKTITVATVEDTASEADETFTVTLSSASSGTALPSDATATGSIVNDDVIGAFAIADASAAEGDAVTFTVTHTPAATQRVTVDWATSVASGDTAAQTDFTAGSGTLTFAVGDTSKTFTVATVEDTGVESNETFTATLSNVAPAGAATLPADATATGTITDDDTPPVLSISVNNASIAEAAGTSTVTISTGSGPTFASAQTITLALTGTATETGDYTIGSKSLTLAAGTSSITTTVNAVQDKIDDDAETVVVTASNGGDMIGTATVTIDDDDAAPALAVDVSSATIAEAGGASTLTVSTGSGSTFATDQTINLALGGTATAGDDYTIGSSDVFPSGVSISAMLPAGVGTAAAEITIAITAVQDIIDEPDETILIDAAIGQTAVGTRQTVTITDDDQAALTIADAAANEGDEITFTVTLDPVSSREVTVDWATSVASGDTAAQADFTAGSGTLTFAAGDSSKTFTVATAEETVSEPDETFTVTLSGASGATLPADATATGTITDDDQAPLSIAHASAHEGDSATFTVTLNPAAADEVTVDYATSVAASDTAAQSDFTAGNGTLTFAAGDTTETFTVATLEDSVDEVDETFTVTLSNASGSTLPTDPTATGTIIDDDQAALTIADAGADEGDDITFTVTLNPVSSREVTVDWATSVASGDTAVQADFTADSGTLTFAAGDSSKTFTVATTEETNLEPDETFTVTLSDASEATLPADPTATGTIGDDDTPRVSIASGGDVAQEGTAATFTLTMSPAAPTGGLTVNVTVAEVERRTLEAGELAYDFVAAASEGMTTVDFAAGDTSATLTVPTVDDDLYEAEFGDDNLLRATLAAGTGYAVATGSGTAELTLRDGADKPVLSWQTAKVTVTEGTDENAALELTLSHGLVGEFTAQFLPFGTSASQSNDFEFPSSSEFLTFTPGAIEGTLEVRILDDTKLEATETFEVRMTIDAQLPVTAASEISILVDILDTDTMQLEPSAVSARVVEGDAIKIKIDIIPSGACNFSGQYFVTVTPSGDTATLADADAVEQRFGPCDTTRAVIFATEEDTVVTDNRALSFTVTTKAGTDSRITMVTDNVVEVEVIDDDTTGMVLVPGAPGDLTATGADTAVTLSWTAPGSDGGAAILKYRYRYSTGSTVSSSATWRDVPDSDDAGASTADERGVTVTELVNETQYAFEVQAVNGVGEGPAASASATPVEHPNLPSVVLELRAQTGDGAVTLEWGPPLRTGSDGSIDYYEYRYAAGRSVPASTSWATADAGRYPFAQITGLENGRRYAFEVRAVNKHGFKGAAATLTATPRTPVVQTLPSAPRRLSAAGSLYQRNVSELAQVELRWETPADIGNTTLVRYEYRYAAGGDSLSSWVTSGDSAEVTAGRTERVETVRNLEPGTAYRFEVRAVTMAGAGRAASARTTTPASERLTLTVFTRGTAVEGEDFTVGVRRSGIPASDEEVLLAVVEIYDSTRSSYTHKSVDIAGGAREGTATFRVPFDGKRGASRELEVTLSPGSWVPDRVPEGVNPTTYRVGTPASATVRVSNRDALLRVRDATVREGPQAVLRFDVSLDRAAAERVTVDYATSDVTATAGADYTATSDTLSFAVGEVSKTVSVAVLDDAHDEGTETLMLTLSNAQGAALDDDTATGTITNTDPMPKGWLARFGRTSATQVLGLLDARFGEARAPASQLTLGGNPVNLSGLRGNKQGRADPDAGPVDPAAGPAPAHTDPSAPADADPFDVLAAQYTLDDSVRGLAARHADPAADPAPAPGAVGAGGEATLLERLAWKLLTQDNWSVDRRQFLSGSSFDLSLSALGRETDAEAIETARVRETPGHWSLWGRGALLRFTGQDRGLSLDGDVLTGLLGLDYSRGRWLAGVGLAYNDGNGAYRAPDSGATGELDSTLVSVHPYLHYALTERLSAWGTLGYGAGGLSLRPGRDGANEQETLETDIQMRMGALGLRGTVFANATTELALKSDLMWVRTTSSATAGLAAVDGADASRVRLLLTGRHRHALATGAALTPNFELGLRYDDGDAETGAGVELGGGLRYADPALGLTVEATARALLAHEDGGYEEWGMGGSLQLDPGRLGRGLSLQLASGWGLTDSSTETLWQQQTASGLTQGAGQTSRGRVKAEWAYGLDVPWTHGLLTPYGSVEMAGGGGRTLALGWRFELGQSLSLRLTGERRETALARPEHGLMLQTTLPW